ncbi:hypothetical protein PHET_10369 [Paragonimus heterotremus]|uniref:Uncharacterized protein n=1 Tax=Paragonimus heterotremus TaxID=100268 RepID=A0A8J4SJT7_9TREM|nr:hypothetical protein PHET_10369 [Paragonimus heterotremus]
MVLTKLVNTNDPELQKELQQINLQQQLPDMGELLSSMSIFGGSKKTAGSGRRRTGAEDSRATGAISDAPSPSGSGGRKEKKRRA